MRHGMEVSPVMYETEDGQEYVGDFQADYHGGHGAEIDTSAFANYNHENPDSWEDSDLDSEYTAALFELHPQLHDAIDWASTNLPEETLIAYNNAIDSGDYTWINESIENLIIQYENAPDYEEQEYEYEPEDDEEDGEYITYDLEELGIDDEVINEVVQELQVAEPGGEEFAAEHIQAAQQCAEAGNDCGRDMCTLAAQFHMGEIDADSAIEWLTDNYDDSEIIGNHLYFFAD